VAVLLAALVCGCAGEKEEEKQARPAPEVPGVETATVSTAPIRDLVRATATVAAEGETPEVRDARTALAEAEARRELAAQQVRRLAALADGVAPRRELEAARAEEASAAAAAARARAVLATFGSDAQQTPLGANERWVIARIVQVDVPRVAPGGEASFVADALPGDRFAASVDGGVSYVDPATLTAPLRLRTSDPEQRLRPGMTGAVALEVGAPREAVVVPAGAVVYDDAQPLVFVAEDGGYAPHPVKLGVARDGRVEIVDGLDAGTRVVVTGAASLLSQARLPAGGED